MKIYFADTNIFIRFLLRDNPQQASQAKKYFSLAKEGKIQIIILSEILFEIDYILRKVYGLSRLETTQKLSDLVGSYYFDVKDRSIFIKALELYPKTNFDLVDIFLFERAKDAGGDVLSFDKDFERLKKLR